jgi:RNA polymerase sigma-70 factor, ECF subfamily
VRLLCHGRKLRLLPQIKEPDLNTNVGLNLFLAGVEKKAFRMARFAVNDSDNALDIVQDSMLDFVRLYRNKPEEEWSPLFYRVLNSRISDAHRRSSVRNRIWAWFCREDEDDGEDPVQAAKDPSGIDPLKSLELSTLGSAIERAVSELPLRQQQAFLLRSWEGLDVEETAIAMTCSQGSVKTHYFRAVQALKEKLKEFSHE